MSARPYRRKDLKHDELVTRTGEISRWLMQRRRRFGWGLLVVVVALSVVAGVRFYRQRQEERAAGLLAIALQIYRSPVVAQEPEPEGDPGVLSRSAATGGSESAALADEHGPAGHRHFRSEQEKYEAARQELESIAQEYSARASGKMAAFYLGLCEAALGNTEAAAAALQRAAGASQELIAGMAQYRLGLLYLERNRPDDAIASFDLLLSRRSDVFPREEALMAKARAHEAAGDRQAALTAYQQVVDDYGSSFSAIDARARVEELSAQLGLDPNAERL